MGINVTTKNGEVFSKSQIIFLGVKPAVLNNVITDINNTLPSDYVCDNVLIVSMLAGVTIKQLHEVCSKSLKLNNVTS